MNTVIFVAIGQHSFSVKLKLKHKRIATAPNSTSKVFLSMTGWGRRREKGGELMAMLVLILKSPWVLIPWYQGAKDTSMPKRFLN